MGKHAKKTPYKKHLKEEKAKVKLKVSHKTKLLKGQNVTKTGFKVKKLVLKEQLKVHDENEILSKSNLNVQELLTRLNHHNMAIRNSGLQGLTEVISTYGILRCISHLPTLLEAVCRLLLDIEADIRSNAVKLLTLILSQVTEDQITPLFDIIVKYLTCAMSHINGDIRESSLIILDTLIAKNAKLTAIHCEPNILPTFLDLISIKFNNTDRKLNLHHSNRITTIAWRVKVLGRLHSLLKAIAENNVSTTADVRCATNAVKHVRYSSRELLHASLYSNQYTSSTALDVAKLDVHNDSSVNSTSKTQEYISLLIPLLLDIFMEAAPGKQTENTNSDLFDFKTYVLSSEAAILLKYITNIILLVWKILSTSDNPKYLKRWFSIKFSKSITEKLINNKFPYSQVEKTNNDVTTPQNKKRKAKKRKLDASLNELRNTSVVDVKCIEENLNLVNICILMEVNINSSAYYNIMADFLMATLKKCNDETSKLVAEKLVTCMDTLFASNTKYHRVFDLKSLIIAMKYVYDGAMLSNNDYLVDNIFNYLSRIVIDWKLASYAKLPAIQNWIDGLPKLLTRKKISFDKIKAIANIGRCNITAFNNSLDGYIEQILDCLPSLTVISHKEQANEMSGKRMIINLLYFVETWDAELVNKLTKAIENRYFGILTDHVNDIVQYRSTVQKEVITDD